MNYLIRNKKLIQKNSQIQNYLNRNNLKEHEIKLIKIIKKNKNPKKILDIGCSNGNFIFHLSKLYKNSEIYGFDISKTLIKIAKNKCSKSKNVFLKVDDILKYKTNNKYDLIIASGVLGIFDDYKKIIKKYCNLLNKNGKLFFFNTFSKQNIDVIIRFKNYEYSQEWESGLNRFSIEKIKKYVNELGFKSQFIKFNLEKNLKKGTNPINSYTIKTNNRNLIVNEAGIIFDFYYLCIT